MRVYVVFEGNYNSDNVATGCSVKVSFELRYEVDEEAWGKSSRGWDQKVRDGVEGAHLIEPYKFWHLL